MEKTRRNTEIQSPLNIRVNQRGLSLLEVVISTVVLGIAIAGFLMAMSTATYTSQMAIDESQLTWLASAEVEALRGTDFESVPFIQTSNVINLNEVPDYFKDIAISDNPDFGGNAHVVSSGDYSPSSVYVPDLVSVRDYAFDGKRAESNLRWMGDANALAYVDTGGGPDVEGPGGGGGGPSAGGPGGGPGTGGDYAPNNYQFIYCSFPELTKISRILFDNRFNVTEDMSSSPGDFDYLPHKDDVWQRNYQFFYADNVLGEGEIFDPWVHSVTALETFKDLGYQSSGIHVIFNNYQDPLEASIIGIHNIDTYSDFDPNFHWPYVSEIEVYGFDYATNFVEVYDPNPVDTAPADMKPLQYNNVIMYFPNYRGSGFDLGRHVYVEAPQGTDPAALNQDLLRIDLEFYESAYLSRAENWQQIEWWMTDKNELAKFSTVFYRDVPTRVDRLPNLSDLPVHKVYDDGEDLRFSYTVPGASEIRGQFGVVDVEGLPTPDSIIVEDGDGNVYPAPVGGWATNNWTDWITGDTLVIHFVSNSTGGNTYDSGYTGFEINAVEIKWVGVGSENP